MPLGVVGIIYENRPNVTSDAAALCVKSGNAAFLRGSSGAISSNIAIAGVLREAMAKAGGLLGHGGVVLFDDTVDLAKQARFAFEFCATESCGKCTPCRIGAVRGFTRDNPARAALAVRDMIKADGK